MLSRTGHTFGTIIINPFNQTLSLKGIVRRVYAVNGTRRARTLKSPTIIYCYGWNGTVLVESVYILFTPFYIIPCFKGYYEHILRGGTVHVA